MIKYDVFDPNHDVAGNDISKANGLKSSEIAYTTLGIGAIYHGEVNADCAHDAGIKW